ncbi:MAG TPA: hypothetical protein VNY52_12755, partial [Solirubrobacteraceae bacterium]|nr:hypothetical protein [Solirubrobacteraceae bacterium]
GQNGVVLHQSTKIAVIGCAKVKQATHKKKGKGKGKGRKAAVHKRLRGSSARGGTRGGGRKG